MLIKLNITELKQNFYEFIGRWGLIIGFIMIGISPFIWSYDNTMLTIIYHLASVTLIIYSIGSKFA